MPSYEELRRSVALDYSDLESRESYRGLKDFDEIMQLAYTLYSWPYAVQSRFEKAERAFNRLPEVLRLREVGILEKLPQPPDRDAIENATWR